MHPDLAAHLQHAYDQAPAATTPLKDLVAEFRHHYPDWTRSRIVAELAASGYQIGLGRDRTAHIVGLLPRVRWQVVDGQLQTA